jgi:hypothetical protein
MGKSMGNPLSTFEGWSVTGWSATFQLIKLNLMDFVVTSKKIDENAYYRATLGFVRPSRVTFSEFTASTKALIQKVYVSLPAKGVTTYRLEFNRDSFIEIVARECAMLRW